MSIACAAQAGYFIWETVELPTSTGAACSDGSPYRFFVNRTPFTTKTVVVFEGGGACWSQGACGSEAGLLGARNPNGISKNYISTGFMPLATPLAQRIGKDDIQTQGWNQVYMPYCTGDVHSGNKLAIYNDKDSSTPLVYQHRGARNIEIAAQWLKANMKQPEKLLVTGSSAGGTGSTVNYPIIREALNPIKSSLLADSGPLFPAPKGGSISEYPSLPLHTKIRDAWGFEGPEGLLTKLVTKYPGAIDAQNLGNNVAGLSKTFPQDRFGFMLFQSDGGYSDFSYSFFNPEIAAATGEDRLKLLNVKWRKDISNWTPLLDQQANVGYYIPYGRDFIKSHTLTMATFNGTVIKEARYDDVRPFINNIIDGNGTPIRQVERKQEMQKTFGVLSPLIVGIMRLFGV